jgi:hypothetical protein
MRFAPGVPMSTSPTHLAELNLRSLSAVKNA